MTSSTPGSARQEKKTGQVKSWSETESELFHLSCFKGSLLVISFAANLPTTRRAWCRSPSWCLEVQMPSWKKNPKNHEMLTDALCRRLQKAAGHKKMAESKIPLQWRGWVSAAAAAAERPCCFASNLSPLRCLPSLTRTAHTWEIYHNEYLMWRGA